MLPLPAANGLSPGGSLRMQLPSGPIDTFHFIGLEKGVWHFQFTNENPPIWNLENTLLDGMGWGGVGR